MVVLDGGCFECCVSGFKHFENCMKDIDGFILAGGASSRMKRDKANLLLGGKTFVERATYALSAVAPERLFVVGNLKESFNGLPILSDEFTVINNERKRCAIIGLHTALSNTKAIWAAVLACDLPFVSGDLFQKLASFRDENSKAIVPVQADGRAQPLCALYRAENCLPIIEEILNGGDWSLQNFLRRVETRYVRFDEISDLQRAEYFFFNVNTPDDYAAAQAALVNTL